MNLILVFFVATSCLLSGYSAGYKIDLQHRIRGYRLQKVFVPSKLKCIYKFAWVTGSEVLLHAFVIETAAMISALLVALCGVLALILPFSYIAVIVTYIILFAYGLILIGVSGHCLYIDISYSKATKCKYKRCWECEIEAHLRREPPHRTVYVISRESSDSSICQIVYGRLLKRQYSAVVMSKYKVMPREYANAIYTSKAPYFVLLSRCEE